MRFRLLLLTLIIAPLAGAQPGNRVLDLRGDWLFHLGDDPGFADPSLNDRRWDHVFVPSAWETEGFAGYDGWAWYRRHFKVPTQYAGIPLTLQLGRIDDADAVYVNGHFVGSTGRFPDVEFQTAYDVFRSYSIPAAYLRADRDNVVAVRVFDDRLEGGILEGQVGLFEQSRTSELLVDLSGPWQFRPGGALPGSDSRVEPWHTIHAPGRWEVQGFPDLDGYALYRKTFVLPKDLPDESLVLLLGRIDDVDEVYINGRWIGATGDVRDRGVRGDEWQRQRAYSIPDGLLAPGATNEVLIRVYDSMVDGGIYEGPLGITTADRVEVGRRSTWLDRLKQTLGTYGIDF